MFDIAGVLSDRAPSRRPLTPMQTFLGSDGSYISTPVQRYTHTHTHLLSVPIIFHAAGTISGAVLVPLLVVHTSLGERGRKGGR